MDACVHRKPVLSLYAQATLRETRQGVLINLMSGNSPASGPILAIDIGSNYTRCMLFAVTDGPYRLLGIGSSVTTIGLHGSDVRFGLRLAMEELQAVTGQTLLNRQKDLIQPVDSEGSGVSQCVATVSAGPPLKLYIVTLGKDIPQVSVERLARSTYSGQTKCTHLTDEQDPVEIMDEILAYKPDLMIIVGGTEKGTPQSFSHLLEPVHWAFQQFPEPHQPEILFAGNESFRTMLQELFGKSPRLHLAGNGSLEQNGLTSARATLAQVTLLIRSRQIPGLVDILRWAVGNVLPTYWSFSRVVQHLCKIARPKKGVTGIDIGDGSATLVTAHPEHLSLGTYAIYDWPGSFSLFLGLQDKQHLKKWLMSAEFSGDALLEHYFNQALYPSSLPISNTDQDIANELNRYFLRTIVEHQRSEIPTKMAETEGEGFAWGEPILVSGDSLTHSPPYSQLCLTILDCLQPVGITTVILDPRRIAASLGALDKINPQVSAQLLDSDLFLHLATIITPVGRAPNGSQILRVKMRTDDGIECVMDVHQGELEVIPLSPGRQAQLQLQPFHRFDIGMGGAGRGGGVRITGSILGIVIDARGRPLILPDNLEQRGGLYRKWLWMMGA